MDRTARKQLEEKVAYLSRRLNRKFVIDYYNPGDNEYAYRLVEVYGNAEHDVFNDRMTALQFRAYLRGMIDCVDCYATAGV